MIVAFNGVVVGGGVTITLAADVCLASESARFSFLFSRRGFSSEGASNWFLPRVVGMGKATEWMLTGRMIEAKEALTSGLFNEIVPIDALMIRARDIAADIVNNTAPVAVPLCLSAASFCGELLGLIIRWKLIKLSRGFSLGL